MNVNELRDIWKKEEEIAHIHGGDVTVESLIGRGSTFTVRIPIK